MEIKVNIPKNDYKKPTEAREEVVQTICEIFLKTQWNVFHPFAGSNNGCRNANLYIVKGSHQFFKSDSKNAIRVRGVEMQAAFEALIKAGYHMFRVYEYGEWMGYCCSKKPFIERGTEVKAFSDFID